MKMMHSVLGLTAMLTVALPFTASADVIVQHQQVRFNVSPAKTDPVWNTPGVVFQKQGSCTISSALAPSTNWPSARGSFLDRGTSSAPLFNPGAPKANGSYNLTAADDGFNTLFVPLTLKPGGQTMICRGAILANGQDVTQTGNGTVVADTLAHISTTGPMTVTVSLDRVKLAVATKSLTAPPVKFKVQPVYKTGHAAVHEYDGFDPDTGIIVDHQKGLPDGALNFVYDRDGEEIHYIFSKPPLLMARFPQDGVKPDYRACLTAVKDATTMYFNFYPSSKMASFCILTKEGRISEISVVSSSLAESTVFQGSVLIQYTTWEK